MRRVRLLALAETINNMTDTLATFADQVTTVRARSRRRRQARRSWRTCLAPPATWKDLTGNVNLLADNLTNQVRAIAEVATAEVTKGDLYALDSGGSQRGSCGPERQPQHHDRQPAPHHRPQHGAGLAQDESGPLHGNVAGAARSGDCGTNASFRTRTAGKRAARRHLPDGNRRIGRDGAARHLPATGKTVTCGRLKLGEWDWCGQCASEKRENVDLSDLPPNTIAIRSGLFEAVPRNVNRASRVVRRPS